MNLEKKYELTQEGLDNLNSELEILKTTERDKNLEALKEARAQGDLSENADYEAARDEQARIESRIKEIEDILKNVEIIAEAKGNKVTLGKTVVIQYSGNKKEEEYILVGELEADPLNGKISNQCPVGKAIQGRKLNDEVKFTTETGKDLKVKIINIK